MKTLRYCLLIVFIQVLAGCALVSNVGNLAPIPSKNEFLSFSERVKPLDPLSKFRSALVEFINEYYGYAADRRAMEWDSTGLTTTGGIAAVLGSLADRTGLLNTGVGLAGLGLVTSSRYNFSQQSQVYIGALRKLACIHSKVGSIPDTVIEDAKGSSDQNAAEIAKGAMSQLIGAVETVRIEANNGILGISPGVPTRDELLTMLKSFLPPVRAVGAGAPEAPDPDAQRRREAGELVKTMLSEVGSCVKT